MARIVTTFVSGGILLLISSVALLQQHRTSLATHQQLELARAQHRESVKLREEQRRLAAAGASAEELARLRTDHRTLDRLRQEIDQLRVHIDSVAADAAPSRLSIAPSGFSPAREWRNRGRATPHATLETTLWAGNGGEIETLAACLALPPRTRAKAEALLTTLPEEIRANYPSAEALVALLLANEFTFRGAQIIQADAGTAHARLHVTLENAAQQLKRVDLTLQHADESWRVVVPESAIDRYGVALKTADGAR